MRLVQLQHPIRGRKVGLVKEPNLVLIRRFSSIYELSIEALYRNGKISHLIDQNVSEEWLDYNMVYSGQSEWKLLPSFDHPSDDLHCLVSGTGLTHKASAENRQKMHQAQVSDQLTDSMKIYQMGEAGGKPEKGTIGIQPEWFYKGNGSILKGHGEALAVPPYAKDGGEEPEIAGIYIVDYKGKPWRIGFTVGNEFSDHVMEKENYLYLAPSKIRHCALGPELVITTHFHNIKGTVSIFRGGKSFWQKKIATGENNMSHSLANLEYHHFKHTNHQLPGQAHVHFFGADAFSFGEQITLQDKDEMEVKWEGMGRALRNTLTLPKENEQFFEVKVLM